MVLTMPSMQSSTVQKHKWLFLALGTHWSIETQHEITESIKREITKRIDLFDATYSRFRPDSLVSQLEKPGIYTFPQDISALLAMYTKLYDLTDKKMTPLIGSLLSEAGYDSNYSFQSTEFQAVADLSVLGWDGNRTLNTKQPVMIDVGAAGKGYLVDIIAAILTNYSYDSFVIDASGDMVVHDIKQTIGLEHPGDPTRVIGAVEISGESLCASAGNRRQWGNYHHIFDPLRQDSVRDIIASWVIAPDALTADALATALFFVPADRLTNDFNFSYVVMKHDGSIDYSPRFEGQLFI